MRSIASARRVFANAVWLVAALGLFGAGSVAPRHAQNAVCADVKIEIKQKLSLERQGFDAVMRINNGLVWSKYWSPWFYPLCGVLKKLNLVVVQ
jgi:hypothetical protein